MKRVVVAVGLALMMGGCAAQRQSAPPPVKVAIAPEPQSETPPPPTGAEILAAQPSQVRAAVKEHEQSGKWPVYRTPAFVLYPYGEGAPPLVDCAPLRTTDIQLEPGETITDVAMGDTERWMATPASSGDPRSPVPHLAVKPQLAGIETNLTIYTTRHIYHLLLRSRGRAMQEVEFYYPDDLLAAIAAADQAHAKAEQEAAADPPSADSGGGVVKVAAVDPAQLNFDYEIDGPNVRWRPERVFDDGAHVYLQMAPGMKTSEAPALLVKAAGGTQMINYRVAGGSTYVTDELFNQAVMMEGVGRKQDRVTITYSGASR
jgi:P-type conjugative transfer protein TrbG